MSWLAGDADSSSFRKWDKPIVSRQGRTWAQKMRHEESLSTVLVQTWTEYDKRKVCCLVMVVLVKRTRFDLIQAGMWIILSKWVRELFRPMMMLMNLLPRKCSL